MLKLSSARPKSAQEGTAESPGESARKRPMPQSSGSGLCKSSMMDARLAGRAPSICSSNTGQTLGASVNGNLQLPSKMLLWRASEHSKNQQAAAQYAQPAPPSRTLLRGDLSALNSNENKRNMAWVETLVLRGDRNLQGLDFTKLAARYSHLKTLDLSDVTGLRDQDLKGLAALGTLKELNLSTPHNAVDQITDAGLAFLPVGIESLCLARRQKITGIGLVHFSRLRQLDVNGMSQFSDAGLAALAPTLEQLNLGTCHQLSEAACLDKLSRLPRLHTLQVTMLDRAFTDAVAGTLSISLIRLNASGCEGFKGQGLQHLKNLRILDVGNCENFGDQAVMVLPPQLRYLNARNTLVSGRHIDRLQALNSLILSDCEIDSSAIPSWPTALQQVDLDGFLNAVAIDPGGLSHLHALTQLRLANCKNISDQAMQNWPVNLSHLDLSCCDNPDFTGAALARFSQLKQLNLSYCAGLTALGLKGLATALPRLEKFTTAGSADKNVTPSFGLLKQKNPALATGPL